ncbi:hypothetical protein BDN71DRAFT_1205000 [Pleurotus eryngii]|uniref:Uncharacterized protein n=1 Tax=Pleurotus eryngii TaxID=5323 RepID=A0A9P5ZQ11_PLEER|nr:hypothetical protein BDN71DRAFT_1205000 [Pleurotus eryngii]
MSGKLWNRSATTSRRAHARNSRMCIGITSYRGINMVRRNLEVHTRPWFDDRAHERFSATVESAECGSAKPASGTIFSSRPHCSDAHLVAIARFTRLRPGEPASLDIICGVDPVFSHGFFSQATVVVSWSTFARNNFLISILSMKAA